jgi:hypothetical protein
MEDLFQYRNDHKHWAVAFSNNQSCEAAETLCSSFSTEVGFAAHELKEGIFGFGVLMVLK